MGTGQPGAGGWRAGRPGHGAAGAWPADVVGGLGDPAYGASKAAVLGLERTVAAEMARSRVRVNAISPHVVPTPLAMKAFAMFFPGMSDEEIKRLIDVEMNVIRGAVLEAEDIARAALYLASDEAKFVSGQNLLVDGGFSVSRSLGGGGSPASE